MQNKTICIVGAGIAGLSAHKCLLLKEINSVIIEKQDTFGGLCNSFNINGFVFDTFAHISFDNDQISLDNIEKSTDYWTHRPEALNYANNIWIKNPVQNNLSYFPVDERIRIIKGYVQKPSIPKPRNYHEWLVLNFGEYFSNKYPEKYTKKYWTIDAEKLEHRWIVGRMTTPDLEELLRGAMEKRNDVMHYSKEARYPKQGGIKSFLGKLAENANIMTGAKISEIDSENKRIVFKDGTILEYDHLVSTIPLDELITILSDVPDNVIEASEKLDHTSGAIISFAFNKPHISPALWFYIYDEDILPARVYSPDWKSPNNVPEGCSAMQAEVYFSKYKPLTEPLDQLKERVIDQMLRLNLFKREDILFSDIRYIEYANVMFTPPIYEARQIIHDYLDSIGILYAGRWGEWDYLWMGQSLRSGKRAAERILAEI